MSDKALYHQEGFEAIKNEKTGEYEKLKPMLEEIETELEELEEKIEEEEAKGQGQQKDKQLIRSYKKQIREKNKEFRNEFEGTKIPNSYRAHSKTPYVTNKIDNLIDLKLLTKYREKTESQRNKILTDVYDITRYGALTLLTLDLQNSDKNSNDYNKILSYLLDGWLNYLPLGYKDHNNHYYYILKKLFQTSIDNKRDIVLSFISFLLQFHHVLDMNFSQLRSKMNLEIFDQIIKDNEFKTLFYKILEGDDPKYVIKFYSTLNESIKQEYKELIKYQFKLDIENHIDIIQSDILKFDNNNIQNYLTASFNLSMFMKGSTDLNKYAFISRDMVLTFDLKNRWEKIRNMNLSRYNIITIIKKCNRCNLIYPYSFEIEKESFDEIPCKYCKNNQ